MEWKNAITVCLISFFSATLVLLIARALDVQTASRLEPQLAKIAEELQAIRESGTLATAPGAQSSVGVVKNGVVVYYLHGNTRCPTCLAIESQSHEVVQTDFGSQLASGELAWKILNYESPDSSALAEKFAVQMPVIVLARMVDGEVKEWKRLDRVWALVNDKPAFATFLREEIEGMLATSPETSTAPLSDDSPSDGAPAVLPVPESSPPVIPLPDSPLPIPPASSSPSTEP